MLSGLRVAFPAPPAAGIPVLVTTAAMPAGSRLAGSDVRVVLRAPAEVPHGALTDPGQANDRVLAAPIEAGELLTEARLHGAGLLAGQPPGRVAVAISLADHAMASVLRPGDEVSVLTPGTGAVVAHATVLAIQAAEGSAGISLGGTGHLVVALTATEASAVAAVSAGPEVGFVVALHSS